MSKPTRVQLFVTCLVDSLYPQVGEAVVAVLERLGVTVEFPEGQTCCGQPGFNGGFQNEARQLALHTLDVFEPSPAPVVVPSGSCAAMVIHRYPELFADDPPNLRRAQALAARTYEFAQFLVDILGVTDVGARYPGRLTYHASCHLSRELGVVRQPRALLAAVQQAAVVELPQAEECCGFGGLFAIKQPALSEAMLEVKLGHVRSSGAEAVVGCDVSCLLNLQGALTRDGSPVRCVHLAEVLERTGA